MGSETLTCIYRPLPQFFFALGFLFFLYVFHHSSPLSFICTHHLKALPCLLPWDHFISSQSRWIINNDWHSAIWRYYLSSGTGVIAHSDCVHSIYQVNPSVNKPHHPHPFGDLVSRDPTFLMGEPKSMSQSSETLRGKIVNWWRVTVWLLWKIQVSLFMLLAYLYFSDPTHALFLRFHFCLMTFAWFFFFKTLFCGPNLVC